MFLLAAGIEAAAFTAAKTATASTAVPFDITQILQFGLLGLIFLCVLFRKFLVPEWVLKQQEVAAEKERVDLEKRLTETREQLDKLQDVFQDQMIPALTKATEINARYTEEMQKARYQRRPKRDETEE
jgi:hypothetical protein